MGACVMAWGASWRASWGSSWADTPPAAWDGFWCNSWAYSWGFVGEEGSASAGHGYDLSDAFSARDLDRLRANQRQLEEARVTRSRDKSQYNRNLRDAV